MLAFLVMQVKVHEFLISIFTKKKKSDLAIANDHNKLMSCGQGIDLELSTWYARAK